MNDEAVRNYREALEIKSDFVNAHVNLGNALAQQGSLEEANLHYQEAMRIRSRQRDPNVTP